MATIQLGLAKILSAVDEEDAVLLEVTVPPTRSDILHAVDIAEDIGIAYGYKNIVKTALQTCTVGWEQPLNQLGDLLCEEIGWAGTLRCSPMDCTVGTNFTALRRPVTAAVLPDDKLVVTETIVGVKNHDRCVPRTLVPRVDSRSSMYWSIES